MTRWPPLDTLKAFVTYGTSSFVVIVGMGAIYGLHNDPAASDTVAIFAGFVGGALSFMFGQEVQARTARQSQTSTAQGAQTASGNGHTPPTA